MKRKHTVSKPQRKLYELVKSIYPDTLLEHPVGRYSLDIALTRLRINIEYDGSYWHKRRRDTDRVRDRRLLKRNWVVIRFEDYVPSEQTLLLAIHSVVKKKTLDKWVGSVVQSQHVQYHMGITM